MSGVGGRTSTATSAVAGVETMQAAAAMFAEKVAVIVKENANQVEFYFNGTAAGTWSSGTVVIANGGGDDVQPNPPKFITSNPPHWH